MLIPTWAVVIVVAVLLTLMMAYGALGRYAQQVTFLTPLIVFVGSGGSTAVTAGLALERVLATVVGALLAGALALLIARDERAQEAHSPEEPVPTE